jgi:hypothetical protein
MRESAGVLIVSVGATTGWRGAAQGLADALSLAGVQAAVVGVGSVPEVRTFMLTDLVQAAAARRAAQRALEQHPTRAVIYCSMTAALLWPRPGAVWLDALAAENRPGRHGIWQRRVERRRAVQAPLLLTMSPGVLDLLDGRHGEEVVVPVAVDPSGPAAPQRDIDAIAYAADPVKRRLELIIDSWQRARRTSETLLVAGIDRDQTPWRDREPEGVRFVGRLPAVEYRALVRRARVFLAAPRREDFGIAPLEALADGAMLVTTPAAGPYPALGLAQALDPRLVSEDLPGAVRAALDAPAPGYAQRAAALVAPFGRASVAKTLRTSVLPALLPGWSP